MATPRHNWKHHEGTGVVYPSTLVERCAYCGTLTKTKIVETKRVGINSATFSSKEVPIYSLDGGVHWQWDRPGCTGKKAAVTR